MRLSAWVRTVMLALSPLLPASASAQADPRMILQGVIQQLSTGTPNPTWYGPQLWAAILAQTGNSGIYPQLVTAGLPTSIMVIQQQQLPQGIIFKMQSQHASGMGFEWLLGLNAFGNRIEYMISNSLQTYVPGQVPNPFPNPNPNPGPNLPPTPAPNPGPTTIQPGGSSCERFPDLC